VEVRIFSNNAGARFRHPARRAQGIVRTHFCRRQPEQRVCALHRLLHDGGITVLSGDHFHSAPGERFYFSRMTGDHRNVGFTVKKYVDEFAPDLAGRSGNCNSHDDSPCLW
jgi:hypothetical protein